MEVSALRPQEPPSLPFPAHLQTSKSIQLLLPLNQPPTLRQLSSPILSCKGLYSGAHPNPPGFHRTLSSAPEPGASLVNTWIRLRPSAALVSCHVREFVVSSTFQLSCALPPAPAGAGAARETRVDGAAARGPPRCAPPGRSRPSVDAGAARWGRGWTARRPRPRIHPASQSGPLCVPARSPGVEGRGAGALAAFPYTQSSPCEPGARPSSRLLPLPYSHHPPPATPLGSFCCFC